MKNPYDQFAERREQILLYAKLSAEKEKASTSPDEKDRISVTLTRIGREVLGTTEILGLHDRMMAEVAREKSDLQPSSDDGSAK